MNELVVSSAEGVLAVATVVLAAMVILSLVAITLMYRYFHNIVQQQNQVVETLRKDLTTFSTGSAGHGNRLDKLELKMKFLARRQYLYEVQQMKNKNYERAKNMINRGEKVDKVIDDCKITKTEAELILLAHRMNRVA